MLAVVKLAWHNVLGLLHTWCMAVFHWDDTPSVLPHISYSNFSHMLLTRCDSLQVTSVNLGGYLIAFGGVCWYNYKKLQAMKVRQAAQAAAHKADLEEEPSKVTERSPLNGKP